MFRADLIKELKDEHKILEEMLEEVKRLKITNPAGRLKLNETKDVLLKHLEKEDAELYPPMTEQAQQDFAMQKILDEFTSEMAEIAKGALAFFDKYSNAATTANFIVDFYKLINILKKRINREENLLYEIYLKYANK